MVGYYFDALHRMVREPSGFFEEYPGAAGRFKPLGFLVISSLVHTGAALLCCRPPNVLLAGMILFTNAVGMALILSGLGYLFVRVFGSGPGGVPYHRFFGIYALASGTVLPVAWIPFALWFTEPWKWWLIAAGLSRSAGLGRWQITLVVISSFATLVLLYSLWLRLLR